MIVMQVDADEQYIAGWSGSGLFRDKPMTPIIEGYGSSEHGLT
jgi:hypothetical protein